MLEPAVCDVANNSSSSTSISNSTSSSTSTSTSASNFKFEFTTDFCRRGGAAKQKEMWSLTTCQHKQPRETPLPTPDVPRS